MIETDMCEERIGIDSLTLSVENRSNDHNNTNQIVESGGSLNVKEGQTSDVKMTTSVEVGQLH